MNRRTLLTQVVPCGLGSFGVLALIPGCASKKEEEPADAEIKDEDEYFEQEKEGAGEEAGEGREEGQEEAGEASADDQG